MSNSKVLVENNSFKVMYHPERQQPYTVWNKDSKMVVKFTDSLEEVSRYVG